MTSDTTVRRIEGGTFDPSSVPSSVFRVVQAATVADGAEALNEAALLALRHRGLEGSTLFVADDDGFAWVHGGDDGADDGRDDDREVDLVVAPEARGRGVGSALARAVDDRFHGAPLSAWSHGNDPAAAALAGRFGLSRVRDLWVMRRSLRDLPALDDGAGSGGSERVDVRPFRPGQDEEAFLALNAEAFAHHPEQGRMTRADLEQRMAEPWFDASGFFVAESRAAEGASSEAGGALLGFHWTKVHDAGPPHGEVYVVGVSPRAQGMGLGRLLTLTGLHHLASLGLDEVILYVEADNAAAIKTYSGLGFSHADRDTHVQYRRLT